MNTIGQVLKEARKNRNLSLEKLEDLTKIKKEFIVKLEKNDWAGLPEFAVVSGFVKNISNVLEISENNANALLRRDYPPKKIQLNPKPDLDKKFTWSPKLTFSLGVLLILLVTIIYLSFEYLRFIKPPILEINSPQDGQVVVANDIKVKGFSSQDATVTVNNQPVIVDADGNFYAQIEVNKETNELKFVAVSRSGKRTEKNIKILVE